MTMKRSWSAFHTLILIFGVLGIVFLAVGIIMQLGRVGKRTETVTAEVMGFQAGGSRQTLVHYEWNGEPYETFLKAYQSSWNIGDEIELAIDPENPREASHPGTMNVLSLVFGGMGAVFLGISLSFLAYLGWKERKRKQLIDAGNFVYATVLEIRMNPNIEMNSRHPDVLYAEYVEPEGRRRTFRSDNIWEHTPVDVIGERVRVYVDPERPKRYYVDLASLPAVAARMTSEAH